MHSVKGLLFVIVVLTCSASGGWVWGQASPQPGDTVKFDVARYRVVLATAATGTDTHLNRLPSLYLQDSRSEQQAIVVFVRRGESIPAANYRNNVTYLYYPREEYEIVLNLLSGSGRVECKVVRSEDGKQYWGSLTAPTIERATFQEPTAATQK